MRRNAPVIEGLDVAERLPDAGGSARFHHAFRAGEPCTVKLQRETGQVEASFRREARLATLFDHPALPRVSHVGSSEGWAYLVRDPVRGRPLAATLPLQGGRRLARLACDLGLALAQIHAAGQVHRWLHPGMLWVDSFGRVQWLDLAALTAPGSPCTAVAEFCYGSPEQLGVLGALDERSDLYSLGAVLYACATGRPPLEAPDLAGLLQQLTVRVPPHVLELNPAADPIVAAAIGRLIPTDPGDRFSSASELLVALGSPVAALPPAEGFLGGVRLDPEQLAALPPTDDLPGLLQQALDQGCLRLEWGTWTLDAAGLRPAPQEAAEPAGAGPSAQAVRVRGTLEAFMDLSLTASTVLHPEVQARVTLDHMLRLLGAERAFLYLLEDDQLRFWAGRDASGRDLETEPRDVSRTVLERVRSGEAVFSGMGQEELTTRSVLQHNLRSVIAAPLSVQSRRIGVIYLDNRITRGLFSEDHVLLVRALGNHIAQALETARAARLEADVQAERRERRFAEILRETISSMAATLEEHQVLDALARGLARAVSCGSAQALVEVPAGIPTDGEPCAVREGLAVPVAPAGTVLLRREGEVTEHELEVARVFATHAAVALENARLFQRVQRLATVDELTGVWNRRHFFELARREAARSQRSGAPLGVLMLDIDHFKKFNDSYGHAVGDAVLAEVAGRCHRVLRETDIFGRYGGEEFAAVLTDTGDEQAVRMVAERLREGVSERPLDTAEHGPLQLTVSIGAARGEEDLEALLSRADAALYRAKAEGRNRVRT
ncbi:MAG: diguanylate cyclase [Candidatus Eremiobacterota bacterium]